MGQYMGVGVKWVLLAGPATPFSTATGLTLGMPGLRGQWSPFWEAPNVWNDGLQEGSLAELNQTNTAEAPSSSSIS